MAAVLKLMPLDPTCPPCGLMGMMEEHVAAGWITPVRGSEHSATTAAAAAAPAAAAAAAAAAATAAANLRLLQVWDEYKAVAQAADGKDVEFREIERFEFYEVA